MAEQLKGLRTARKGARKRRRAAAKVKRKPKLVAKKPKPTPEPKPEPPKALPGSDSSDSSDYGHKLMEDVMAEIAIKKSEKHKAGASSSSRVDRFPRIVIHPSGSYIRLSTNTDGSQEPEPSNPINNLT